MLEAIDYAISKGKGTQQSIVSAVKERPILFSSPLVRAILAGDKTDTRRIAKLPLPVNEHQPMRWAWSEKKQLFEPIGSVGHIEGKKKWGVKCPYGKPGERLWVREAWSYDHAAFYPNFPIVYRADNTVDEVVKGRVWSGEQNDWYPFRWKPSIHMKRIDSRINLEVVSVRIERLQEITEADAIAEGTGDLKTFTELWHKINGKDSWNENPFVWVVKFKKI